MSKQESVKRHGHHFTAVMAMASKPLKKEYPRIAALGLVVHTEDGCAYVKRADLIEALRKKGWLKRYSELYGVQTQSVHGPYPHDCEAVLERLATGKRVGTQLLWD